MSSLIWAGESGSFAEARFRQSGYRGLSGRSRVRTVPVVLIRNLFPSKGIMFVVSGVPVMDNSGAHSVHNGLVLIVRNRKNGSQIAEDKL